MKVTRISRLALATVTAALALAGCGDDGNSTPDAPADATSDTPTTNCTAPALASDTGLDTQSDGSNFAGWHTTVTTDLGDGAAQTTFDLEFFAINDIEFTAAPIDLSMGDQNNYATCEACVLVREADSDGNLIKAFFQSGGSMTLTANPIDETLAGTISDLSLVEVTIDSSTYTSTVVDGGACLSFGNLTLAGDSKPFGWTCDASLYSDGATCDCDCGIADPDCDDSSNPIAGCTTGQVCVSGACTDTCDVLGGEGCATGTCAFYSDDEDLCRTDATLFDSAALGETCGGSASFCGVANTIAEGICDVYQHDDETCTQVCGSVDDCGANEICAPILTTKGICTTVAANDTCAAAVALTLGTPVTGTSAGATNDYNSGLEASACTGYSQAGQDVVYSVQLTAGQNITVALSDVSADFDPSISIVGPGTPAAVCDVATLDCLAGADAGFAGDGESFDYAVATTGTYYIIVDTYTASVGGTFTLTVSTM